MLDELPNLRLLPIDTSIKSTTQAILLSNRGRGALSCDCMWALESYGMALIYLAISKEPTRDIYWKHAVRGLEAAMLCAFQIENLSSFGRDVRDCVEQLPGLKPEEAAERLQNLILRYANNN